MREFIVTIDDGDLIVHDTISVEDKGKPIVRGLSISQDKETNISIGFRKSYVSVIVLRNLEEGDRWFASSGETDQELCIGEKKSFFIPIDPIIIRNVGKEYFLIIIRMSR